MQPTITSKGQITIPRDLRRHFGLHTGTAVCFEIARRDLEIRGPGEFLGARQSGDAMLRFADLATDDAILEWARHEAPLLLDRHPALANKHVQRWLGTKAEFLKA